MFILIGHTDHVALFVAFGCMMIQILSRNTTTRSNSKLLSHECPKGSIDPISCVTSYNGKWDAVDAIIGIRIGFTAVLLGYDFLKDYLFKKTHVFYFSILSTV